MATASLSEIHRFMVDALVAAGTPTNVAAQQADFLLYADKVGHFSHGINRLDLYLNDIKYGACNPKATPKILNETAATAWVDGCCGTGATVGHFCMNLAIAKAKQTGVGWVCAKGSNHFGMAGWWALQAKKEGMIGLALTNTSPVLAPTRSKKGVLGTNPLAMYAPAKDGDQFLLDMSTTTVALGKIEMEIRKNNPIPVGWAQGPDGTPTTDAKLAFSREASLMPLGGAENTAGYKGYGLSALVEIFCGISAGSRYGHHVGLRVIEEWGTTNLGQCFIAVDPKCFAPGFEDRLQDCLDFWRNMEPTDPSKPVRVHGDRSLRNLEETEERGNITYVEDQVANLNRIAKELSVEPIQWC